MSKKAISEIISFVIIVLLSISLFGTAYLWAMPLIIKRQDTTKIERVYNYFNKDNANSLVSKIESVAKNGGQETFTSDTKGIWILHQYDDLDAENNSIEFNTFSKVTNVAIGDWLSLTYGSSCPPENGIVGIDPPLVVCGKAEAEQGGFDLIYKAWSRVVTPPTDSKGYKINLVKHPNSELSSTGRIVTIQEDGEPYTCTPPDPECPTETLIITKVKILLV